MRKRKIVLGLILTAILSMAATYAVIQTFREVENQVTVSGVWGLEVLGSTSGTPIYTINWGTMEPGWSRSINQPEALGEDLKLKNRGNNVVFVAYQWINMPADVSVTVRYEATPGNMVDWVEGSYDVQLQSGEESGRIWMQITVSETAAPNTFSWTIKFNGADSSSG